MDNYVIRIYRREKDNPRKLVGVVEEVGVQGKKAFTDLEDLWEILNSPEGDVKRQKNKRRIGKGGDEEIQKP